MRIGNMKLDRNVAPLVKLLLNSGRWRGEAGRKHYKMFLKATGEMKTVSSSSSDHRMVLNFIQQTRSIERRAGFATTTL